MSTGRRPPREGQASRGFTAISATMLAVSTAIALIVLWPIYQDFSFIIMATITVIAASFIAILGARYRWSSLTVMLVIVGTYFAIGVPLAVPGLSIGAVLPTVDGLKELFVGTATSWKQLVTISAPVGDYGALLVPAFILILLTVAVSLTLALRTPVGDLAVLGPIVIFVVGIIFGSDLAIWPFPVAFGLTTSLLVWLIWARWYRRRASLRLIPEQDIATENQPVAKVADGGFVGARTLLSAGIILAIAGTSAFAAAHALPPKNDRVVLRNTIAQPFSARDYPSPLSGFRAFEQPARVDHTIMTVTGLPARARIRIATLDSYDGVVFGAGQGTMNSVSGAFTRVPLSVDQSEVNGTTATMTVTVGDYDDVWVPTVGKLERISFEGARSKKLLENFYFNRTTDTAAVVGGLSAGDTYSFTAVLPEQPSESTLSRLQPGNIEFQPLTSVPDELATTLESYVAGILSPGGRLVAMLDGLKRDGYVSHGVSATDPPSRSGHAADRITELLTSPRMIGDQEQFAVTAALMARQLGFPARVVFGFAPAVSGTVEPTTVTGGDVSAWIEVDTIEHGWVTIDPTPPIRPIPEAEPQDPTEVARPQSPVQPQIPPTESFDQQQPPSSSQDDEALEDAALVLFLGILTWLGWVLLAGLVLISPLLIIAVAKLRRRRLRRSAPTPLQQIEGGWNDFADSVLDHGYTPGPTPTRLEVAHAVGGTQPYVLAAVADRAVFAPGEPDREQAAQLWTAVDDLRYALGSNLTRWQRLKVLVSLRSLGGYSFRGLFSREGSTR